MDNFEYLNQISQSVRPAKPKKSNKFLKISLIIGGIAALVTTMAIIIGAILSHGPATAEQLSQQLRHRISTVNSVITTYNPNVKSSKLRAIGASLSSILVNTGSQINNYYSAQGVDPNAVPTPADIAQSENNVRQTLNTTLQNAKLNGLLDRFYHNQLTLQTSLIIAMESELLQKAKNPTYISIIESSLSDLNIILKDLNEFDQTSI